MCSLTEDKVWKSSSAAHSHRRAGEKRHWAQVDWAPRSQLNLRPSFVPPRTSPSFYCTPHRPSSFPPFPLPPSSLALLFPDSHGALCLCFLPRTAVTEALSPLSFLYLSCLFVHSYFLFFNFNQYPNSVYVTLRETRGNPRQTEVSTVTHLLAVSTLCKVTL